MTTLAALGWPTPVRAVLALPVALFWAAALAALLEAIVPSRRLGPATLAFLGAAALAATETFVLS